VWATDRLPLQIRLLDEQPRAVAVLGRTRFFFTEVEPASFAGADDACGPRWFLGIHCGLYRRVAFDTVGPFDNALRYHEDIDWLRRALAVGLTIHPHADVVLYHRRHAGNMTNNRAALQLALLRMLRQSYKGGDSLLAALTGGSLTHE
jgi:GT2 family glycosyltransferase